MNTLEKIALTVAWLLCGGLLAVVTLELVLTIRMLVSLL